MEALAFEKLALAYKDSIYRIAVNYCRNGTDADDITQNALIRLYRSDSEFESEEHARNWIIRVAINESKRWLASPQHFWAANSLPLEAADVRQENFSQEESGLYTALMKLPGKYRVTLYLHYYEGYTACEIAALLGTRPSTVTTRLARGRMRLKMMLAEDAEQITERKVQPL